MNRTLLTAAALLLALGACAESDVVEKGSSSESSAPTKLDKEGGSLLKSGFAQRDEYVALGALVKNNSKKAGQTVTVSFNMKDAAGKVVATESQVDNFAWPGQELAVVTQADVPGGKKIKSIEATLLIEDEGTFDDATSPDLGSAKAPLAKDEYGGKVARVKLTNPTSKTLKSPGVKVLCTSAGGKIVGSGYTFPDLIAAKGQYAEEIDVNATSAAKSCQAYLVPSALGY